ncbi:MAG: hypothetical protein H0X29_05125 [Parachlamydiaceae bacterium]|nr:hypothetical protein [Parachlamydiaceae bacterium]
MNNININPSSSPAAPVPDSGTNGAAALPITTNNQPTDTLSTASAKETNHLSIFFRLAQPVYLAAWSKNINLSVQNSKERILGDDNLDISSFRGIHTGAILTAEALLKLQDALIDIGAKMATLYDQQVSDASAANSSITSYNSSTSTITTTDQDNIDKMNLATAAYKASEKTDADKTTYNKAIADYNKYVNTTRVNNYNTAKNSFSSDLDIYKTAIDAQNANIDAINELRQIAGIPDLPHVVAATPTIPAQTTMPAAPSTTNAVKLANATVPADIASIDTPPVPPTGQELVDQYATPLSNSILPSASSLDTFITQMTQYRDYQRYYLGPLAGKISTLPNSYVDQKSEVFIDESIKVGSGAGVSMASMIAGLSSPNLSRVLSNSIANEAALKTTAPLTTDTLNEIRLINLTLLSRAGLGSSIPAFSLLSERLAFMDAQSPSIKIALSLGLALQISTLSNSADLQQAILNRLIAANPSTDPVKLAGLGATLTAASNLSLALFAVSQLAQSLNSPELTGQVLGLINTPATNSALESASITTTSDVLNNPLSASSLKADLASTLASDGTRSQNNAEDIAKGIIFDDIKNESELKDSINEQLIQAGISSTDATALANQAAEFIRSEINSRNILDTKVESEIIQSDNLNKQLRDAGVNADIIAKVVPNITNATFTSQRELRDGITKNLTDSGLALEEARRIATDVVRNDQSAELIHTPVSDTQLAQNIAKNVTDNTSVDLGANQSQQLASTLINTLIGNEITHPLSITNIIRTNLQALSAIDDVQMADTMRAFIKPSVDLFSFNQRILDPANSLVLSTWTGLMYSSEFKHTASIDIIV